MSNSELSLGAAVTIVVVIECIDENTVRETILDVSNTVEVGESMFEIFFDVIVCVGDEEYTFGVSLEIFAAHVTDLIKTDSMVCVVVVFNTKISLEIVINFGVDDC